MARDAPDDVPRLPRGRGIRLGFPQIMRIAMVAALLVALIVMQRPCSEAVSRFVTSFDPAASDAGVARPPPPRIDPYEGTTVDTTGMTAEQAAEAVKKALEASGEK